MEKYTLTVLPMSQAIEIKAGEEYEGTITVASPDDATGEIKYKVSVGPYSVVGEDYTADLATENNRSMIVDWIKLSETNGTIKPGEKKEVGFTVKVPKEAPAGGQYAAISVSMDGTVGSEEGANVLDVAGMGSIVYATVEGETEHKGQVLENRVPGYVSSLPVKLESKIQNEGNVHEMAKITISATDVFTGRVILPSEGESGEYTEVIMPETIYAGEREISDLPLVGMVKVSQKINYMGEESYAEQVVVICPVWFMILAFMTLVAFVVVVVTIVKRYRRRRITV